MIDRLHHSLIDYTSDHVLIEQGSIDCSIESGKKITIVNLILIITTKEKKKDLVTINIIRILFITMEINVTMYLLTIIITTIIFVHARSTIIRFINIITTKITNN